MDSTEDYNNQNISADMQDGSQTELQEIGRTKIMRQIFLEDYDYCITEDIVSGMHRPLGKPHHAYQLNI